MKKVLSISLGSSKRDHKVKTNILGEDFIIERRGTDGDKKKAAQLFAELDGQYDAFGMGGIDLSIYMGGKQYFFRDAKKLIKNVRKTPVVDGSGLKNTLERKVLNILDEELGINFKKQKVLLTVAMDRFGMAETFVEFGSDIIFGDLMFGLGLPIPLKSLNTLDKIARLIAPLVTKLPFELVYPTGKKQETVAGEKYTKYYDSVDIIAGDYHYIRMNIPERLDGKIIITNTVTQEDVLELKNKGVQTLITTTPDLNGRSFGTNVMEGVLVALSEKRPEELTGDDYNILLDRMGFTPRIVKFNRDAAS